MKRPLIAAAIAAVVAIPFLVSALSANVGGSCTTAGVQITLTNFTGTHNVPWTVEDAQGNELVSGTKTLTGSASFEVELPASVQPGTPVTVGASWGKTDRDRGEFVTRAKCVDPPANTTTTSTTPTNTVPVTAPEPTTTNTTTTPPPPKKRYTCATLPKGAGAKWRKKLGCTPPPKPRACPLGTYRYKVPPRVSKKGYVCLGQRPGRVQPEVTG